MSSFKYAIGRIRSQEARMLDENKLVRLCDADSFQSAFNILNESDYSEFFNKVPHPFDFDAWLNLARLELKNLSDFLAPKNKIIEAFWARYDFENIKILLKAKLMNLEEPPLFCCGNIDPVKLKRYLFADENTIESEYKELIAQALSLCSKTKDFLQMFRFLDEAYEKVLKSEIPQLPEKAKYLTEGILPVLNFLASKEAELMKIGLILECKKRQVPSNKIKERIFQNV